MHPGSSVHILAGDKDALPAPREAHRAPFLRLRIEETHAFGGRRIKAHRVQRSPVADDRVQAHAGAVFFRMILLAKLPEPVEFIDAGLKRLGNVAIEIEEFTELPEKN